MKRESRVERIEVMSRSGAELQAGHEKRDFTVISITNPEPFEKPVQFPANGHLKGVFRLQFYDPMGIAMNIIGIRKNRTLRI